MICLLSVETVYDKRVLLFYEEDLYHEMEICFLKSIQSYKNQIYILLSLLPVIFVI